jgi:ferredoxin-type protein NapH
MDERGQQRRALAKKIAYPLLAAGLFAFFFWQHYRPDPMWFGRDKDFWYETIYVAFVVGMGVPVLIKWRRSRYFAVRTVSCMVTQILWGWLVIYYLLPMAVAGIELSGHWYPFTAFAQNLWPLEIYGLVVPRYFGWQPVVIGWFVYVLAASLILMPVLVLRFGRAYCSWFCACGNLAETAGDPFRTQSPKGTRWVRFEWGIGAFVLFAIVATIGLGLNRGNQSVWQTGWGFWVKFVFAGALGLGLYPVLGNRPWCRYWCPWAGLFGALSKLGRSGIAANNMCMACGMCNKHCDMGIDIRRHAMHGQVTKTTSCVYCGACVAVCPRNVLRVI